MRLWTLAFLPALVLQSQTPDLAPILQVTAPEVDRLIQVFQPKIALDRVKGIVPTVKPPCVGGDFSSLKSSTQNYRALAGIYLLQGRAAMAAGAWEEAQQAFGKGLAVAQENQANYSQNAQPTVDSLLKASVDAETFKKEKTAQIKELIDSVKNVKSNPLEILKIQQSIKEQEELVTRSRQSVAFVMGAKKDLASDIQALTEAQQTLDRAAKAEKETIATFNAAKKKTGNSAWVTAALADKGNAAKYPTAKEQSDFLHRLAALDPANGQIPVKIEGVRQGKSPFAAVKAAPVKATKKKK